MPFYEIVFFNLFICLDFLMLKIYYFLSCFFFFLHKYIVQLNNDDFNQYQKHGRPNPSLTQEVKFCPQLHLCNTKEEEKISVFTGF